MEDKQSFDTLSAYNIENSTIVSEFAAKVLIDQFNKDQHEWVMNATHFYNTAKQHEIFKREEIIKAFNEVYTYSELRHYQNYQRKRLSHYNTLLQTH